MTRESELARLHGKYPRWEAWRGISGLWYARLRGTPGQPVTGEDVTDLADQIERAQRLAEPAGQPAGSPVYWSSQDVQLARDARALEQMLSRPRLAAGDRAMAVHALSELYAELNRRWPA